MRKTRLLWKIYPTYIVVILLCAGVVGIYAIDLVKEFYADEIAGMLYVRCLLVSRLVDEKARVADADGSFEQYCRLLGEQIETRITVIAPDGKVLCDSIAAPDTMDNHGDRPEVRAALVAGRGRQSRYSYTLGKDLMYVAVPLRQDGEVVAVVRTAVPLTAISQALGSVYCRIALSALFAVIVAGGIGFFVSRRISRQLSRMRRGAERFARGDFSRKLADSDIDEVSALSNAFNRMASRLDETIATISRQKNEQQAVLSSMTEGVLALDAEERVISLNSAAAALIGSDPTEAEGRTLQEVIRNRELESLVSEVLKTGHSIDREIALEDEVNRLVQVRGTVLRDAAGLEIGVLVVLNDITRLRRLENVRRDFVANVSHELKTPVTSIKGFVETLREGALKDPARAERFLDIVSRQVNRLSAIIEDLLSLSRLEQESDRLRANIESVPVADLLNSAINACEPRAAEENISISLDCPTELRWKVHPALLEQAVINLIDNAVKYSEPGNSVTVSAARADGTLAISVRDTGCGIEKKHLPRLFERFYRVDKARSRNLGGTGLGLAIVKHIVQAHGGSVEVESTPGAGSTFTIIIPAGQDN